VRRGARVGQRRAVKGAEGGTHVVRELRREALPGRCDERLRPAECLLHRPGHEAGKGGQHRCHAQRAHPVDNLELKRPLVVHPARGQLPRRAVGGPDAVDVAEALPRLEGGAGKPGVGDVVRDAETAKDGTPDVLLAREREREGDAVERGPVEKVLPVVVPAVKGGRVA
jgi:hypothetical protein